MSKILFEPLSDSKVREALGDDVKILKYSELKKYATIDELLPKINSFFICLLEEELNSGHWVACMRLGEGLFYFNSYGQKYDTDLSVVPRCIRKILNEDKREFSRLFDGADCDWNRIKLQGDKSQTCGRYVVLAITMCCFLQYSPTEFVEFVQNKSKTMDKSCDAVVASIVNI
jgi:hypothetical protein